MGKYRIGCGMNVSSPVFYSNAIVRTRVMSIVCCTMIKYVIVCLQAVETLKMFEKKDSRVKSAAATNLSFLYFLVSEIFVPKLQTFFYKSNFY